MRGKELIWHDWGTFKADWKQAYWSSQRGTWARNKETSPNYWSLVILTREHLDRASYRVLEGLNWTRGHHLKTDWTWWVTFIINWRASRKGLRKWNNYWFLEPEYWLALKTNLSFRERNLNS